MDISVSNPDPGEFRHPLQNGHRPGLVADGTAPCQDPFTTPVDDCIAVADADLPGAYDVFPLDAADVGEALAAPGIELTGDILEEQARALEAEFRAELDRIDHEGLDDLRDAGSSDAEGGSYCNLAQGNGHDDGSELLPGFETLTHADLDRTRLGQGNQVTRQPASCPVWCAYADLPGHGDGQDATPETEVPHRGVEQDIPIRHGGQSLDHAGRAEVALQLEQDRDLDSRPVITLSVVVRGIEQFAWLTSAEARTLHRTLGQLLDDATGTD